MNNFSSSIMMFAFLTVSFGYGQWSSFDLDPIVGVNFSDEVKPLLKGTAMSLAQVPQSDRSLARRFKVGLAYSHGIAVDATGFTSKRLKGLPSLQGAVIVTKNILTEGIFEFSFFLLDIKYLILPNIAVRFAPFLINSKVS